MTPISMEEALRQTLKKLREEAGLSLETFAQRIAAVRTADGRKETISHATISRIEGGQSAAPRSGWDELVADYAAVLGTTPRAIWAQAAEAYGVSLGVPSSRRPRK